MNSKKFVLVGVAAVVVLGAILSWQYLWPLTLGIRGTKALKAGDYGKAIVLFEEVIASGDDSPYALSQLVRAYAAKGTATGKEAEMYGLAYSYADKALQENPDNTVVLKSVGYLAETAGYYKEATKYYLLGLVQDREDADMWFHLGHAAEFSVGLTPDIVDIYLNAYRLDPNHPLVLLALGRHALSEGTQESLERGYNFFLGAARNTDQVRIRAEAWTNASRIRLAQGNIESASNFARHAVNADRSYAPGLVAYAETLVQEGKVDEALGYVAEAGEKNPRYSNSYYVAGAILRSVGDYNQSIQYFSKALEHLDNDNTLLGKSELNRVRGNILYDIAKTYDMAGRMQEARAALSKATAFDGSLSARAQQDFEQYKLFEEIFSQ